MYIDEDVYTEYMEQYSGYGGYYNNETHVTNEHNNQSKFGFMGTTTTYKKRPDYAVQPLKRKIPVNVPSKVLKQIKFLTSRISSVEWSGVLFYTVVEDINHADKFAINLEHIFLMDKGTSGSTEYDYNEELIDFRIENPDSLKWKIGHIHSHNSMGTYFSTTDKEELEDNVKFHNYYLSLIVNNALDMSAMVAFLGELEGNVIPYNCKNGEGKPYKLEIIAREEEVMFTYDCEIFPEEEIMEESFLSRLKAVVDRPVPTTHRKYTPSGAASTSNIPASVPAAKVNKPKSKVAADKKERGTKRGKKSSKGGQGSEDDTAKRQVKEIESYGRGYWMDDFPPYWLQFGNMASEFDFTIDALENIRDKMTKLNKPRFIALLLSNSVDLYQKYFPEQDVDMVEAFSQCYNALLENIDLYDYVEDLLNALDPFIDELSKLKLGVTVGEDDNKKED